MATHGRRGIAAALVEPPREIGAQQRETSAKDRLLGHVPVP
jgi:hypothetical protein